jgi:hypothetical protein
MTCPMCDLRDGSWTVGACSCWFARALRTRPDDVSPALWVILQRPARSEQEARRAAGG